MRHTLLFSAITAVALLAAGCMEQQPPEAYNENLAASNSDTVLLPMAPVGADPAIVTADAGALPEPTSAAPAASAPGGEAPASDEAPAGNEPPVGDENESS
jgi:hypothetical protein